MSNDKIIIANAFWNLGETTISLEIAKMCKEVYNIIFLSFGGDFENVVIEEGFEVIQLEPRLDAKKVKHLYKIDRGETWGNYFSTKEIRQQVKSQLHIFEKLNPVAILSGFDFSSYIAARIKKIPLFSIGHTTWMIESYLNKDVSKSFEILNEETKNKYINKMFMKVNRKLVLSFCMNIIKPYNRVMKEYGLKEFKGYEDWWKGDYTLLSEPKAFTDIVPNRDSCYIGPMIGKLNKKVPDELNNMKRDNGVIYFAMGSSGKSKIIRKMLECFRGQAYTVIAPIKAKLSNKYEDLPPNVIITDWIPADIVNNYADIAVIHGGLGTVMTTILSGIPFIGIPMQPEQELTIDYCVKRNFAIKVSPRRIDKEHFNNIIKTMINNVEAKHCVDKFKNEILQENYRKILLDFLEEKLKG